MIPAMTTETIAPAASATPAAPAPPAPPAVPPAPKVPWSIDAARALYNVEGWGAGFFDINDSGHVVVRPDRAMPAARPL